MIPSPSPATSIDDPIGIMISNYDDDNDDGDNVNDDDSRNDANNKSESIRSFGRIY